MLDTEQITAFQGVSKQRFEIDFPSKYSELLRTLKGYQQSEGLLPTRFHIGFGPTYHTRSSGQIDNTIKVIFVKDGNVIIRYSLVAMDREGKVIGYRRSSLSEEKDRYVSVGYIYTGIRAKGISTVIDSAHADFLQRLTTQYNKPIIWEIFNDNAMKLGVLEEQLQNDQTPELSNQISEKRVEQARWQSQYGTTGRFGIGKNKERIFNPQISRLTREVMKEDVELIENIFLGRKSGNPYEAVEIERIEKNEQPLIYQKNLTFFRQLITDTQIHAKSVKK